MKAWKALTLCGAGAILATAAWPILRSSAPEIDPPTAERLAAITDGWCGQSPGRDIPPGDWPVEVQRLRPQAVRVSPDGVYIERGTLFVESWGVFVLRAGSSFLPTAGSDPSYRPLLGRVYWYEIKG